MQKKKKGKQQDVNKETYERILAQDYSSSFFSVHQGKKAKRKLTSHQGKKEANVGIAKRENWPFGEEKVVVSRCLSLFTVVYRRSNFGSCRDKWWQ